MRTPKTRRAALAAICLLAAALGAAHALAARGGLSITPGIFEAPARPGGLGAAKVSNTTAKPMRVRVIARPWIQSRSGSVSPDRRHTLGKLHLNPGAFRLPPGATRTVGLSLSRPPARGSLFGAIETTGTPRRRGGKGVKVAYRLITSMRLYPPRGTQVLSARAGRLIEHGTTRRGSLLLEVKSTGNTIVPIGGTVRISGEGHTLSGALTAEKILPGSTVNLALARLRGTLPSGRYNVSVHLTQGGHPIGKVRRRGVRLR